MEGRSPDARETSWIAPFVLALALALSVMPADRAQAQSSFKLVPGLIHGAAPRVVVDRLDPSANAGVGIFDPGITLPGICGRSVTTAQGATSAPVGLTRQLVTNDDPNCGDFWGSDKWRHIGVWFVGTAALYLFFKSVFKTSKGVSFILSAAVMTGIGLAREISDANSDKNCFSEQDLFANSIGILAAGVVIAIF